MHGWDCASEGWQQRPDGCGGSSYQPSMAAWLLGCCRQRALPPQLAHPGPSLLPLRLLSPQGQGLVADWRRRQAPRLRLHRRLQGAPVLRRFQPALRRAVRHAARAHAALQPHDGPRLVPLLKGRHLRRRPHLNAQQPPYVLPATRAIFLRRIAAAAARFPPLQPTCSRPPDPQQTPPDLIVRHAAAMRGPPATLQAQPLCSLP